LSVIRSLYPRLSAEHLATAEALFAKLRAAADEAGLKRSDAWLAETAVDAALRGGEVGGVWAG
jgi:hypothetical protein